MSRSPDPLQLLIEAEREAPPMPTEVAARLGHRLGIPLGGGPGSGGDGGSGGDTGGSGPGGGAGPGSSGSLGPLLTRAAAQLAKLVPVRLPVQLIGRIALTGTVVGGMVGVLVYSRGDHSPQAPAISASSESRPAFAPQELDRDANLAAERRLLERAQQALLGGDTVRALEALAVHQLEFPHGRLCEERDGLRVQALARAGRLDEARRAGAALRAAYPHSLLLPAVETTLKSLGPANEQVSR